MQSSTGELHRNLDMEELRKLSDEQREQGGFTHESLDQMIPIDQETYDELWPLPKPVRKNKMRNKPCPCGSEKKFKRCCWSKYA